MYPIPSSPARTPATPRDAYRLSRPYHRALLDNLHLRLFEADALPISDTWNTRRVQSSFWRFYRNANDGAALELEEAGDGRAAAAEAEARLYPLQRGRLYFVPAGVRFSCRCAAAAVAHFYVHFDVLGLPSLALRELFARPIGLPPDDALEGRAGEIAAALAAGAPRDDLALQCRIKALLYEGLARHLEAVPADARERSLRRAARLAPVLPALEHIEAHLAERLPNARLAACCHLSGDHFLRRFRDCVGQTPAQYLLERRVTIAAQRLLFTDDSIERIAEGTGFGNRFYFSRVFTRRLGVSPAAYRKASRV